MKKLLALVLALVMSMSLVTISNAAFADAADIDYTEAVEVMNAVGVLSGGDGNKFNPQAELTRAQACKIVAYLDLGKDVAEALPSVQVFSDVPTSNWAAKYIAYCADAGYVSGVGDNKFAPDEKVTGYQFGKMLLCVLGYDAEIEQMTGASWQIAVAKLMEKNDISDGVDGYASANLTREEAAQYALNALKATTVEYENKGTDINLGTGTTLTVGASSAKSVTVAAAAKYKAIDSTMDGTKDIVQLGEKLYKGDLKYTAAGATNDFSRPAHNWIYKNETVVTTADTADVVFTASTKAADVAKAMGGYYFANGTNKAKIADSTVTSFTPSNSASLVTVATSSKSTSTVGAMSNTAAYIAALTANGKAVEIYANSDGIITAIVTVEYTVAEVTKVSTNAKGDTTTYTLKTDAGSTAYKTYTDEDKDDEIHFDAAPVKGDIVTVAKIAASNVYVYATTSFTGAQSAYNTSDAYVTINGTKYDVGTGVSDGSNDVAVADFANSSNDSNIYYVDQYGFVVKTTAAAASTDYAYIVNAYVKTNTTVDGSTPSVTVRAVLADGTVAVYDVETVKVKTGDKYIGKTAQSSITLAAGDYVIKDTLICVIDGGVKQDTSAQSALLTTAVFGYTLDGTTLSLEVLGTTLAADSTTLLKSDTMDDAAHNINEDDTSVTAASSKTVLLEKTATIVIYDDDDKVAKVYTGTADLGTTALKTFATVVDGKSSSVGTATIVYATVTGGLAADVSNYVYVVANDVTTTLVDGKTKYSYQGLTPDGDEITLVSSDAFDTDGLYKYADDYTTEKANLISADSRFLTGTMTVTGNLVSVSSGVYYNMEDAQVVYADDDKAEVNGNVGWIVLAKENGSVTANVETIYVL